MPVGDLHPSTGGIYRERTPGQPKRRLSRICTTSTTTISLLGRSIFRSANMVAMQQAAPNGRHRAGSREPQRIVFETLTRSLPPGTGLPFTSMSRTNR